MQAPNRKRLFYALLRTMCVSRELTRPQTTHTSRATPKRETIILDGYQLLTQWPRGRYVIHKACLSIAGSIDLGRVCWRLISFCLVQGLVT